MNINEYKNTFEVLDKKIADGFNRFRQSYSLLNNSLQEAYTQGFLDGIRDTLEDIKEAYLKDTAEHEE